MSVVILGGNECMERQYSNTCRKWNAYDCDVKAEIIGAVTPGALFGRAENCEYSDCSYEVTLDGKTLQNEVGETDAMYESLDQ